jgi:hypothetical protein
LGLNFVPKPKVTNFNIQENCARFKTDIEMQSFLSGNTAPPDLYIRTGATAPPHLVNASLKRRVDLFNIELQKHFTKRKCKSNLLPFQRDALLQLRQSKTHTVFPADKNLGPCIIEREVYIKRALDDHLSDPTTYIRLTKTEADNKISLITKQVKDFLVKYKANITKPDLTYLRRSILVKDPYPKFYLTAKVHKTPWKTRPIVSISGSLLHGLGRWVDKLLQGYSRRIPSYISSSFALKDELMRSPPFPPNARLFTCDAVSMYTNISTTHALSAIRRHLLITKSNLLTRLDSAMLQALELVMKNNVFEFGDTYWHQIDGTAMGVSPSCAYATLYFSAHENSLKDKYEEIVFFKRYIDDIFGIWVPRYPNDNDRWQQFQNDCNKFGKLRWEFTQRSLQTVFLDLHITLNDNGTISTALYEKPENHYLYLPAFSNHPPGVLKGLVYGMIYRTLRLSSSPSAQQTDINNLLIRLLARGYEQKFLIKLINKAYNSIKYKLLHPNDSTTTQGSTQEDGIVAHTEDDKKVFFHLDYHPNDPPASFIQNLFYDFIYYQTGLPNLPDLLKPGTREKIHINRFIVCYHRFPNVGNMCSPRKLKKEDGPLVSTYVSGT